MIKAHISQANLYTALHPLFIDAFNFLEKVTFEFLHEGERELHGRELFVIRSTAPGKSDAQLESHRKYIDIHFVVKGEEKYKWRPVSECILPVGCFDEEKDILFYRDSDKEEFTLHPSDFVIFFPEDSHAPMIGKNEITKLIVKVRV